MRFEHVFLIDDVVAINNISYLIARDQELLLVSPSHRLNFLTMNIAGLKVIQIVGIPDNNLAFVA